MGSTAVLVNVCIAVLTCCRWIEVVCASEVLHGPCWQGATGPEGQSLLRGACGLQLKAALSGVRRTHRCRLASVTC
jgi:hypothetical protein